MSAIGATHLRTFCHILDFTNGDNSFPVLTLYHMGLQYIQVRIEEILDGSCSKTQNTSQELAALLALSVPRAHKKTKPNYLSPHV